MVKNIALLTGGDSSEWQIALQGAANIEKILDRTLYKPYTIVLRDKHWTYTAPDGTKSELDRNDFTLTVAGEKIKQMPGHGLYYYFETDRGFNEMIANFASMSKSKEAGKNLLMLKNIVGEEVYNMISNFYYKEIIQLNTEDLEVSKGKRGK